LADKMVRAMAALGADGDIVPGRGARDAIERRTPDRVVVVGFLTA
jgi:hypothetical protein